MTNKKSPLENNPIIKEALATLESDYKQLFIEVTKCGESRSWKKKNGKDVPALKHPTYPDYLRLDFIHLYSFIIHQIEQEGLSETDFKNKLENTAERLPNTFRQGRNRNISSLKAGLGICTAAKFLNTPLILLLAQFLEECEADNICLASHRAFEDTIKSLLLDAKRIATQLKSKSSQTQKLELIPSTQKETFDGLELVYGEEKWLDPYNLNEILFVARDAELEKLDQFAKHDDKFNIWAIEGPSGAGKTRLTVEWINRSKADTLNGWDLHILHKQDRSNPNYWLTWSPSKPTLIIIDYIFGFNEVINNLLVRCTKPLAHNIRLLVIDHVFPRPFYRDERWGFSLDQSSLNRNEKYFYDQKPLELGVPKDQETVMRGIISQRAKTDSQSYAANEAIDYLKKTQGAWHPLFAALAGDAISSGKDFTKWNRRELISYYLADGRLPWKLDDKLEGRWASYFISVATVRRGVKYCDMIKVAAECESSPEEFGKVKETCQHIIADDNPRRLAPFEPDIFGESFFLLFLNGLESSKVYQKEFHQVFLAGNYETQIQDAIEFIGFIERLTRNLLNDDQNQGDTQELWQSLFNFLRPSEFPKHNFLRWAVSACLVCIINDTKEVFLAEEIHALLKQTDPIDLYEVDDGRLLPFSTVISMLLFDLTSCLTKDHATIPADMYALLERNYQNDSGDNEKHPLVLASHHNFIQTVVSLIDDYGENVHTTFLEGRTALMNASLFGDTEMAEQLLKRGADIHAVDNKGRTAFMWVIIYGHTEIAERLLKLGADIDASNDSGVTALTTVSALGDADKTEWMLKRGADTTVSGEYGMTPLMIAAMWGYTKTVKRLLKHGADIHAVNNDGLTVLILASMSGHTETVKQLLKRGADIHAVDNKGCTALMYASSFGRTETVKQLSAVLRLMDSEGRTA